MEQPTTQNQHIQMNQVAVASTSQHSATVLSPIAGSVSDQDSIIDGASSTIIIRDTDDLMTLRDILNMLQPDEHANGVNLINVGDRSEALYVGFRAALRRQWCARNRLNVLFEAEFAIDGGGPTREFLTLFVKQLSNSCLFAGNEEKKFLALSASAVEKQYYLAAGRILSYSITHRGPLPTFLDPFTYAMIANETRGNKIPLEACGDEKDTLEQIAGCEDEESFNEMVAKHECVISVSGCMTLATYNNKERLIKGLCKFLAVQRLSVPLAQLKSGLEDNGVLFYITAYPHLFKDAFCKLEGRKYTAEDVYALFDMEQTYWSEPESNRLRLENRAYGYFKEYILDIEGEFITDFIRFITGLEEIPVLGFSPKLTLQFRHRGDIGDCTKDFPIANTCGNVLSVPVHNSYELFKFYMDAAIKNASQTFTEA
ncbi:G2/M phase-specific E3 ubiquitin-protein ligase-like [Tubulanus polymorphus]|uniref:G2/M phase-specific E3 ubiquitin-protein ligase-like n=1 Tax=Tubulanus polymorphus TaxID=672921 RepID=UPI003DA428EE